MSDLRHNAYGVLLWAFFLVCLVGLMALGALALNAYSDARHAQYIYDLEHPTPTPTPADTSTPAGVLDQATSLLSFWMPAFGAVVVVFFTVQLSHFLAKVLRDER